MRALVLLFVFVLLAFVVHGVAYAKTPTDIGKPVCTHYDDNAKPAPRPNVEAGALPAPVAPPTTAYISTTPTTGNVTTTQAKGSSSGFMRPRSAPRWQTFLPGMFK
jgi:hypothetical protein